MCANDLVGAGERPAVGMKLGGGYIQLGQELPLEAGEGESKFDFLEHFSVDEAEGAAVRSPGHRCKSALQEDKDAQIPCHRVPC